MMRFAVYLLQVLPFAAWCLSSSAPLHAQSVHVIDSAAVADAPLLELTNPLMLTRGPAGGSASRIGSVALDASGKVYLLDIGMRQVVTVRSDGAALVVMGNRGAGTGEFHQPMLLAAIRDTILVLDIAPRNNAPVYRLHVFDAGGRAHSTADLPHAAPYRDMFALHGTDYGWMAHVVERPDVNFSEPRKGPFLRTGRVIELSPSDFAVTTRITYQAEPLFSISSRMATLPAMTPSAAVAMAGDGRIYTRFTDRYEIDVQSHDGSAETRVIADVQPPVFSRADFNAWLADEIARARGRNNRESREWADGLEKNGEWVGFAPTRPVIGRLSASRGGLVLAERLDLARTAGAGDAGFRRWDLIDIASGIAGRLETPEDVSIAAFEWPYICLRYTGAHGNRIVRYTLVRSSLPL